MIDASSQAYQLLELIALSGELPAAAIRRLPMTESYRYKVVASLKHKKLIRLYNRDGVKAYRLSSAAKELLVQTAPERFRVILNRTAEQNLYRTEITRRLRLHSSACSFITMQNAGVPLFPDEKPPLFELDACVERPKPNSALFYTSREIKKIDLESNKIRSSRICGVLFDASRMFLTYNTGSTLMKWEYQTELRFRSIIAAQFSRNPARTWYEDDKIVGLMLGDSMEIALEILQSDGGYRHSGFRPNVSFDQFWFCPNIPEGEAQLRIQTSPAYIQIQQLLLSDLIPKTKEDSLEHDAWESDGRPVLLALNFDLPRLKRFHDYLELFGQTGQLFCYDFQVPILKKYMHNLADIRSVSLQKVTRRLLKN